MMTGMTRHPEMTVDLAALVMLVRGYTELSFLGPGPIEIQKLSYFLQVAGEPLGLDFALGRYGLTVDNLADLLDAAEGHCLGRYGDVGAPVGAAELLETLPGAVEEAEAVLENAPETRERIDRVLDLACGFESAYSLELLATVHWLSERDRDVDDDELAKRVWEWSPRKARMFTADHVRIALDALREQDWLPQPVPA